MLFGSLMNFFNKEANLSAKNNELLRLARIEFGRDWQFAYESLLRGVYPTRE